MIPSLRKLPFVPALALALAAGVTFARAASGPSPKGQPGDVLKGLRQQHPRLFVLDTDLAAVRKQIESDPVVRAWYKRLQQDARKMLTEPTVERKLIGPRLLNQSRAALRRISTLAGLYRLDGDRRLAERARREMLAAAGFTDWNPSHFLDVAEMTTALAIGYDWLFDFLSVEDRAAIRTAIVEKGLKPGLKVYRAGKGWARVRHNWNQVCNGGMTVGALAVADEEPALARAVIAAGRDSIVLAMKSFAPDGGWDEGPGYWNYATRYNVFYLAALRSALGQDFGLEKMPGFARTGDFRIHSVGPLKLTFNYADAHPGAGTAAQMLWLARAFDRPDYAAHERRMAANRPEIFHLLWSAGIPKAEGAAWPRDAVFRGIDVAFFRSSWNDLNAIYIGFRGGDNKANHSHLDLGSFVLDALGERWALDLGPDDYNLPGYFGKQRWTYYRLRTESHNTLTIDGDNQVPSARAPLVAFRSTPDKAYAVADLTAAYAPTVTQARRGLALLERRRVLVQDEVQASRPVQIVWSLHTRAKVELQGARAILTLGKAKLEARLLSPEEAQFAVVSANPPAPQAQQPDVRTLVVRLPQRTRQVRLAVLLTPGGERGSAPALVPLDAWIEASKRAP
jgi:hypothetical protein